MLQQVAELVRGDDPQVDLEPGVGAQPDPGLAGILRRLHEFELGRELGQGPRVRGGGDDVEVLDAVGHPPRRAGQLHPVGGGMLAQGGDQLLTHVERAPELDPSRTALAPVAGRRLGCQRGGQEALLGLGAEPLELADLPGLGRRAQRRQRVDRELFVEPPRPLGPEPGQPRDLEQAGRELGPQLGRGGNHAVVGERHHLLLDRRADPGQLGRAALAGQAGHRHRGVADRLGGVAVGDDAVDDGPVELVQVSELVERGGDLGVRGVWHRI